MGRRLSIHYKHRIRNQSDKVGMKKTYLTPAAKTIALHYGLYLLQQHSVNPFKNGGTKTVGDADEDSPTTPTTGARYIGDIDEE